MMRSMPPHHTTSMANDLLRGNRLEMPWFAGKMVELGLRHGIPTPVNGFIYGVPKPYVLLRRVRPAARKSYRNSRCPQRVDS
jgi:ketopantoate reductase